MGKKQHYVPQFLLRNWSNDEASIKTYIINKDLIIPISSISSQAQEQYFYGEDQEIEEILNTLETETAPIIAKLKTGILELSSEEKRTLIYFIAMQNVRTPNAIQQTNDGITAMTKNLLSHEKHFKGKTDIINSFEVSFTNPALQQLRLFLQSFLMYADLKMCLLKANNENSFVIGQDPILTLNPYLVEKKWGGSKRGIGLKGVVIILPISYLYSLCFYDSETYHIIKSKGIVELSETDIDLLNNYQFLKTDTAIYFYNESLKFKLFSDNTLSYRENPKAFVNEYKTNNPYQTISAMSLEEYPLSQNLDFLFIKESAYKIEINPITVVREYTMYAEQQYRNDPQFAFLFENGDSK